VVSRQVACSAAARLCVSVPSEALAPHDEALLRALCPNLTHTHSRVRLASVQALDALVAKGMATLLVAELVVPGIRPLASDQAPAVREAAFASVARWLGSDGCGSTL
jgi:HEAT repeat